MGLKSWLNEPVSLFPSFFAKAKNSQELSWKNSIRVTEQGKMNQIEHKRRGSPNAELLLPHATTALFLWNSLPRNCAWNFLLQ